MSPTLVLGVGGTGCRVAKMLRKMIEMEVDAGDRGRIPMRFLGVDTDLAQAESVGDDEAPLHFTMRIAGRAQALGAKDDPSRAGSSFRKWLPKNKAGEFVLDPQHLAKGAGAGGKRLLGRYGFKYFAPNHFNPAQQHVEALRDLCNNPILTWKGIEYVADKRLEVFVVCSLAGGTGSGAFLDAVAMAHRLCDAAAPGLQRGIHLVLVTPSAFEHVVHAKNRNVHKATAYACLKDLEILMSDPGPKTFEFHGERDVVVNGPIADDVFLIGRHGAEGAVSDLGELYRILAIQLYGMIGSPMGTLYDTINNNNTTIDQADSGGGRKRYSAFGLVGLDYDLETRRYRAASAVGRAAAERLRSGEEGRVLDDEAADAEALALVRLYRNGPAAPKVTELLGSRESSLALPSVADEEKPREVAERIKTLAGSQSEAQIAREMKNELDRLWKGDPKAKSAGWRAEFESAAYDLVRRFGARGARSILTRAEGHLRDAQRELEERTAPTTITAAAADAVARLERIGGFTVLLKPERANAEKVVAMEGWDNGVAAHLREIASARLLETVFGANGLPATLSRIASDVRTADEVTHRAEETLAKRSETGASPLATAMDRSRVLYDVVTEFAPESADSLARRGDECAALWLTGASGATSDDRGRRTVEALTALYKNSGKANPDAILSDALSERGSALIEGDVSPHILDVLMPGGDTSKLDRALERALGNLTPLALVDQLSPDDAPYDTTLALLPSTEDGVHPLFDEFESAMKRLCAEGNHSQSGATTTAGRPNRLLLAKWILGFALNDRAYPPIVEMRQAYLAEKGRNEFLEVDARWMNEPGPGQSVEGGRRLLWSLGLAYGLIAQGAGNRYYANLKSVQHRTPDVKGTAEEHEVDAEAILAAIGSHRPAREWLPTVMQGAATQKLGKKDLPLAFPTGDLKAVERSPRDLLGTGRAEAMAGFLGDKLEDHGDLQTGLVLILDAYVVSRGKGEVIAEIEAYRAALETVKTPDAGMRAQLDEEVTMLGLALDNLKDRGEFGLPEALVG